METLAVPTKYDDKRVLVADDEREHIEFFIDYLRAKGFQVDFASTVVEALAAAGEKRYRAYFIDLNIPIGKAAPFVHVNDTYDQYLGLYIIRAVLTQGNAGARVLAYSAHYNDQIVAEIEKLYCKYVVKGRVRELKDAFNEVLKVDPLVRPA